jgi:nucleoside-diphosphate-sugar epimerase
MAHAKAVAVKRVLVTGATGFIGRWSVPGLLSRGYEVHAAGSRDRADPPGELDGVAYCSADLFDHDSMRDLIDRVRPTHLLHFAWIATPGVYWTAPENFRWVSASLHLLEAFHNAGGQRAVMAGSCAEYDWSCAKICNELDSPLASDGGRRATPYATAKIALQKMLDSYGRQVGLSTAWGRIFFQYGPYEHPDRLVASVINALLEDRKAECTPGQQVRGFLHTAEVGDAFAALLDSEVKGPVNIGDDTPVKIAEVVQLIGEIMGKPELIGLGERQVSEGEPPLLLPDTHRLRDEVGWKPGRGLRRGLKSVVEWWTENQKSG